MTRRIIVGLPDWVLGGAHNCALNLVRGLRARGEDARLLLTEENSPLINVTRSSPPFPADVPVDQIRITARDRWSEAWTAIERYLEEQAPCIYVPNVDFRSTCIVPRLSSRVKVAPTMMNDCPLEYEHIRRLAQHWDAVVPVNAAIHRQMASDMPWLAAKLVTIPIGVAMPADVPTRPARDVLQLVYHGRLCQDQKRSLDLVALLQELDVRGIPVRLTLIGDGESRPEIEKRGERFLKDGRLVLLGTLPHDKTVAALGDHDVYVLPSDFEGTPNALLEAMACGCVPVVSDIATLVDIVSPGNTGFRCPPGDIDSFAAAVASLAANPGARAAMARRAATSVREMGYDINTMIDRYQALFDRLEAGSLNSRRSRTHMKLPPATLGGVSILPGKHRNSVRITNRIPLWPDPQPPVRAQLHHASHESPLSAHRIVLAATTGRISGVDVFSVHLVQALVARGLRAEILLTRPDEKVPDPMPFPPDVPVRSLPVKPGYSWRHRWKLLRRNLTEDGPCIYIPNYDWHHSGICGVLPGHVKVVGIVHSDDPAHYAHCLHLGATWNAVVAVSTAIAREVKALAPDLTDRLHTIPYGIEVPRHCQRSPRLAGTPLRLLYAGRLIRYQKRALDLPCILEALAARGVAVELTVVGSGPDEPDFRKAAAPFLDNGQLRLAGGMSNHQVQTLMSQADVFVLPSAFEGLPVALLEAMANGLVPVAAHCRSGVDQVIKHGDNGFLVPVGDVQGFAERIAQLAAAPDQLTRMSQAARGTIETGPFNRDAMADSYMALLEEVATRPFSRPKTGMLPLDHLRGLRSWLPPKLPAALVLMDQLRIRLMLRMQEMFNGNGK